MKKLAKNRKFTCAITAVLDALAVNGAYGLVLLLRYDGFLHYIDVAYVRTYKWMMIPYAAAAVLIFYLFGMYRSVWKYAGIGELLRILCGSTAASVIYSAACTVLINIRFEHYSRMPLTFYVFGFAVQLIAVTGIRAIHQLMYELIKRAGRKKPGPGRALIAGAGDEAVLLLRALESAGSGAFDPVAIVDDSPENSGRYIHNIRIDSGTDNIPGLCEKLNIDRIYVALPETPDGEKQRILGICGKTGCEVIDTDEIFTALTGAGNKQEN